MDSKPNILLVMADQYVPFLSSAYGCEVARTPHLERLASGGVVFDSAYCSYPVCSPSRAAMLTGLYASAVACYDNASILASDIPTLAHHLTLAGYHTALSGKMHFVGPDQLHGFCSRLTTDIFPGNLAWLPTRDRPTRFVHPNNPSGPPIAIDYVTAGPVQWNEQLQYDEDVHARALEFIRSRCTNPGGSLQMPQKPSNSTPWFLCVSYHHPHEPFQPPRRYWDLYADVDVPMPAAFPAPDAQSVMDEWVNVLHGVAEVDLADVTSVRQMRRAYLALLTYIDDKLGELLAALEDVGLRENTVVIFTSDHGDMLGERGMVQKRVFYEWSSRVPLVFNWPTGLQGGRRMQEPVSLVDLCPTICDLAGAAYSEVDGRSLEACLGGGEPPAGIVFGEYHSEGVYAPCFMAREGQFKYIYVHGHGEQLFDVVNDPGELTDLLVRGERTDVAERLRRAILDRFDPDAIEAQVREGLQRRRIIRKANILAGTQWDFSPPAGQFTQFWRG